MAENSDIESKTHLGDIFLPQKTFCTLPPEFSNPIQRIFLTANGNLQRLLSSYYNLPVSVDILYNQKILPSDTNPKVTFDRKVNLVCNNKTVCIAESKIYLLSDKATDLIINQKVGIAQFFRYRNSFPDFVLLSAKSNPDNSFQRSYILKTSDLECHIDEYFVPGMLELSFVQ
ncbi:hypothetical protein BB558_005658 [Smittium angustum]|uniref:Uncharacterized protein n=1 Tax=Smittium angustum TaxID=133377 RepID=A0A2U1IZV2_SMIAN|nr:hypothetical protein BB558_005658 [Smittium angustum]